MNHEIRLGQSAESKLYRNLNRPDTSSGYGRRSLTDEALTRLACSVTERAHNCKCVGLACWS